MVGSEDSAKVNEQGTKEADEMSDAGSEDLEAESSGSEEEEEDEEVEAEDEEMDMVEDGEKASENLANGHDHVQQTQHQDVMVH